MRVDTNGTTTRRHGTTGSGQPDLREHLAARAGRHRALKYLLIDYRDGIAVDTVQITKVVTPRKAQIAKPIPMPSHQDTPDVRLLWNQAADTLPAQLDEVVLCSEYTGTNLTAAVEAYAARGVPSDQIVIVGDLRTMPIAEYSKLAQAGVFLKHIRYADLPRPERQARVEKELRLVYRGLLGQRIITPQADRPRTYEYPPDRLTPDELAAFIAELRAEKRTG